MNFVVLKFGDMQVDAILVTNLQSRIAYQSSLVRVLAEEFSVHRNPHTNRIEAESNFENLFKLEGKAAISLGICFNEPENVMIISKKCIG